MKLGAGSGGDRSRPFVVLATLLAAPDLLLLLPAGPSRDPLDLAADGYLLLGCVSLVAIWCARDRDGGRKRGLVVTGGALAWAVVAAGTWAFIAEPTLALATVAAIVALRIRGLLAITFFASGMTSWQAAMFSIVVAPYRDLVGERHWSD